MNDQRGKHRRLLRPAPLLALGAALPALAAAIRATAQRWYPTLDNGIYSARAWDVGTSHNPMLATWSSRSTATGIIMNHPGPMAFQLLAPFRRLFGPVGVPPGWTVTVPLPRVPGGEVAGTVGAVGPGVTEWALGERVAE